MTVQDKPFGKVAVLMGGRSSEREISLQSGQGILQALRARGVDAHPFDPAERDLGELRREGFARCFIALHGRYGENGTMQGALKLLSLPYTGAGVQACSIAIDKIMTKRVWLAEGLPTPRHVFLRQGGHAPQKLQEVVQTLGLPLIVKSVCEGFSLGLTKVMQAGGLAAAVEAAARLDADVLCEQFIDGEEVTCLVLGAGETAQAQATVRIEAPGGNYDYEHKYLSNDTRYHVPSGLPPQEEARLHALAERAYRVIGCRGWGRLDVMIDRATRQPWLLEINTSPGMTSHSLAPMAARATGLDYEDLCLRLLAEATLDYAEGRA